MVWYLGSRSHDLSANGIKYMTPMKMDDWSCESACHNFTSNSQSHDINCAVLWFIILEN
jgi:hypothetical protein